MHPPPLPPQQSPSYQGLDYQPPFAGTAPPKSNLRFLWLFLAGLIGGSAVSAVAWIGGWESMNNDSQLQVLVWIIPGTKIIVGTLFCCIRGWRGLGAGLLVSIALGFLIFFGTCAVHLGH